MNRFTYNPKQLFWEHAILWSERGDNFGSEVLGRGKNGYEGTREGQIKVDGMSYRQIISI